MGIVGGGELGGAAVWWVRVTGDKGKRGVWPVGPVAERAGLLGRSPVGGPFSLFLFFVFCFLLLFLSFFILVAF